MTEIDIGVVCANVNPFDELPHSYHSVHKLNARETQKRAFLDEFQVRFDVSRNFGLHTTNGTLEIRWDVPVAEATGDVDPVKVVGRQLVVVVALLSTLTRTVASHQDRENGLIR